MLGAGLQLGIPGDTAEPRRGKLTLDFVCMCVHACVCRKQLLLRTHSLQKSIKANAGWSPCDNARSTWSTPSPSVLGLCSKHKFQVSRAPAEDLPCERLLRGVARLTPAPLGPLVHAAVGLEALSCQSAPLGRAPCTLQPRSSPGARLCLSWACLPACSVGFVFFLLRERNLRLSIPTESPQHKNRCHQWSPCSNAGF